MVGFIWHDAHLDKLVEGDCPVTLRYLDTQPDRQVSTPYTTVIAVHGSGFNANIWKPWIQHLGHDIRLLAYNRRGYEGSSPVYEPESSAKRGSVDATWRYVVDMLAFLKYAKDELGIPGRDAETQSGGIVLLGWSKGCMPMIALLSVLCSYPNFTPPVELPCDLAPFLTAVNSHLQSIILFEPGGAVGLHGVKLQAPELVGVPRGDRKAAFARWMRSTVPPEKVPLLDDADDMSAAYHDMGCILSPTGNRPFADQAFKRNPLPVGVGVLYCTETLPDCLESGKYLQDKVSGQPNAAVRVIQGGNHFVMATNPDAWDSAIKDLIGVLSGVSLHST